MGEQVVNLLHSFVRFFIANEFHIISASAIGVVLEILLPGERHSLRSYFKGAFYNAIFICIGSSMGVLTVRALAKFHIRPFLEIDLSTIQSSENVVTRVLAFTVLPFVGVFVGDFFYYWFHRMQHTIPALWRFHRIHHSIRELNATNNFNHVSEDVLRAFFVILPSVILFHIETPQIFLLSVYLAVIGQVSHANTRARFWPFCYLLIEPAYHRVHHSVEKKHFDKNFASVLPLLDVIFGTAYFPKRDEHPRTGIDEMSEPNTIREYLFPPSIK